MNLVLTPQTLEDAPSYNVIADLKGSEHPEQIVIVSGHLDSWDLGTGAIDDAAGVAVAMQTANLYKQLGLRPKRTLRVIAWMNEENGTRGANAYAQEYKNDLANHVGAIESDSGAGHPIGFKGTVKPATIEMLRPVTKILAAIGADYFKNSEDYEADVEPMAAFGVPSSGRFWIPGRTLLSPHGRGYAGQRFIPRTWPKMQRPWLCFPTLWRTCLSPSLASAGQEANPYFFKPRLNLRA